MPCKVTDSRNHQFFNSEPLCTFFGKDHEGQGRHFTQADGRCSRCALKSKSTAVRSKAVAMRARLLIFRLLRSRKVLLTALSAKMQSIMASKEIELGEASSRSIVLLFLEAKEEEELPVPAEHYIEDLLEYEDDDDLKDEEIDHAAAVFIERFRRQMRMEEDECYCIEKQRSLKKIGKRDQ